jgi:hypothetical protein
MLAGLSDVTLIVLPESGHNAWIDRPAEVRRRVQDRRGDKRMIRSSVVGMICLALAGAVDAQSSMADTSPAAADTTERMSAARLILSATAGSAAGYVIGLRVGAATHWGGGDDPDLIGVLVFSALGGAAGTSLGLNLGSGGRVPVSESIVYSVMGILTGAAGAVLVNELTDGSVDEKGLVIGFSIGQGVWAGAIAHMQQGR